MSLNYVWISKNKTNLTRHKVEQPTTKMSPFCGCQRVFQEELARLLETTSEAVQEQLHLCCHRLLICCFFSFTALWWKRSVGRKSCQPQDLHTGLRENMSIVFWLYPLETPGFDWIWVSRVSQLERSLNSTAALVAGDGSCMLYRDMLEPCVGLKPWSPKNLETQPAAKLYPKTFNPESLMSEPLRTASVFVHSLQTSVLTLIIICVLLHLCMGEPGVWRENSVDLDGLAGHLFCSLQLSF